jgi:putative ATPase
MDLFEHSVESTNTHLLPLAERMRPTDLEGFFGQPEALNTLKKIMSQKPPWPNLILWGPPGSGKTTIANILKRHFPGEWMGLNAVSAGVKDIKEIGTQAHHNRVAYSRPTALFLDEIHRLNKSQQDVLLPFTEKGDLVLIGATTENPGYEINAALLSRSRVVQLHALSDEQLTSILERSSKSLGISIDTLLTAEAKTELLAWADGDARRLLNMLDEVSRQPLSEPLTVESLEKLKIRGPLSYNKTADDHYDCVSAFIKSIRGSNPDAALYYMVRMLESGEDPKFIARRLVILASEDIGNADPQALMVATAAANAVEFIGMPEGSINLAQAVTYLSCAPKSNRSYMGLNKAKEAFKNTGKVPVPLSLRSSQTKLAKSLGYGEGYKYSHDYPRGYAEQQFLPNEVKDSKFYEPSERGFEKRLKEYLEWMKGSK